MKIAITHPFMTEKLLDHEMVKVPINEIDNIPNASCLSIYLTDTLDFLHITQRAEGLRAAVLKLRYGGHLIVRGIDLTDVSRRIFLKEISIETAQKIVYDNRRSGETVQEMISSLRSLGLDIITYNVDNMFYYIESKRPRIHE